MVEGVVVKRFVAYDEWGGVICSHEVDFVVFPGDSVTLTWHMTIEKGQEGETILFTTSPPLEL